MEYNITNSTNAPIIPAGKSVGKETMVFALSNEILDALPLDKISLGARELYEYICAYATDEIRKAVLAGNYDFSDTTSKRFSFSMKEYKSFCEGIGKKHYSDDELSAFGKELSELPVIEFIDKDGERHSYTHLFSTVVVDKDTDECEFEITYDFLSHWAPELSELKEIHLLSLTESFRFSSSYQNALYKLLNGKMQEISFVSEYSVPINILKERMGVDKNTKAWKNNNDFIERILSRACKEINDISDISFSYRKELYEKSRRIKNIVFYDLKRKKDKYVQDCVLAEVIEGEYREIAASSDASEKNVPNFDSILSDDEKIMVRIIGYSRNSGFTADESFELYDLYKNNLSGFLKKVEIYEEMIRCNIFNPEDKMKFFKM